MSSTVDLLVLMNFCAHSTHVLICAADPEVAQAADETSRRRGKRYQTIVCDFVKLPIQSKRLNVFSRGQGFTQYLCM